MIFDKKPKKQTPPKTLMESWDFKYQYFLFYDKKYL